MGQLDGKVAIVTGATSGMGQASAIRFAKEGAKVVISGRNEERARQVVNEITSNCGQAVYVIVDNEKPDTAQKILDKTIETFGTVDVLFNNAGTHQLIPAMEIKEVDWQRVFDTNVTTTLKLCQLTAPVMKEKGKGSIIITTSISAFFGRYNDTMYIVSKHALAGLTKRLAWELGPEIRVNSIAPGAIITRMVPDSEGVRKLVQSAALKRSGTSDEIASVALFLATDESSYISGQIIRVDGGQDL